MTMKKKRKKRPFRPDQPERSKAGVDHAELLAALRDPYRVDSFCEALERESGGGSRELHLAKLALSITQVAWTAEPEIARELAIRALVLDPECYLAAMVIAERCAETVDDARRWYEQVVEICDQLDYSIPDSGVHPNPVALTYTETYVAALCALGRIAWHDGNAELAIAYFESALDDDPEDRPWNRVYLINALLAERAIGRTRDVLVDYREPHAAYWTWSNALRLYLSRGDGAVARSMLRVAIGRNAHVAAVLLGRIDVPDDLPSEFEFGTLDEALRYGAHAQEIWDEAPGALEWLRKVERGVRRIGPDDVVQIRVRLLLSSPRVWRRLRVRAGTTLADFDEILQDSCGWRRMHAADFQGRDFRALTRTGAGHHTPVAGSESSIGEFFGLESATGRYVYDFGDTWIHELVVERVLDPDDRAEYPVCLGGSRAFPPEDTGGVMRFNHLVAALRDPDHSEHDYFEDWLGEPFDPMAFDIDGVNRTLETYRVKPRRP